MILLPTNIMAILKLLNNIVFVLLCLHFCMVSCEKGSEEVSSALSHKNSRTNKFLSIFTLIKFRSFTCNGTGSSSEEQGICIKSADCTSLGGTSLGNCAKNHGVCCQVKVSTCGSTIDRNTTYIQNPNYPSDETGNQVCCYTIRKCENSVCSLRLDMLKNTIAEQDNVGGFSDQGDCLVDTMTTTCSKGTGFPANFCGVNDGQHAYLDISQQSDCEICFRLGSGAANQRRWNIKVSQIECDNPNIPPPGCLQYYTENTGTFCNLGYQDTSIAHLSEQQYSICIRKNINKCSITYEVDNSRTNNFLISPPDAAAGVGSTCGADFLVIPGAFAPSNVADLQTTFCGQRLSVTDANAANEVITTFSKPFRVQWITNEIEGATDQPGFCLVYTQKDC